MVSKQKFVPAELKVLGVCSHSALGRAIEIMLKAIGFGTVEMVTPLEAEKKAQKLDPHLILFTEDYLVSTDGKHLQNWCDGVQTVILLKQQNAQNVLRSKEMGFDSIVFGDTSLDKMYVAISRVYRRYHSI